MSRLVDAPPVQATLWPHAPDRETLEVRVTARCQPFLAGAFRAPRSGRFLLVREPATGAPLYEAALCGPADVAAAVRAARAAAPAWRRLPGPTRARILLRASQLLRERARELAVLESRNVGKPIRESLGEDLAEAERHLFHYAGWADKLEHATDLRAWRPAAACAVILPWNYPLLLAASHLAPALAAGATLVLKPAPTTPLTTLRLAELLQQAGVPDGVVNVVPGDAATGAALAAHPEVERVVFVGSSAQGRQLAATLAGRGDRLALELGGKSPQIVCADADLDQAAEGVYAGAFGNAGQACSAGSRLLVEESVRAPLLERLTARLAATRIGDPLDWGSELGPLHTDEHRARVRAAIERARDEGAEVSGPAPVLPADGWWQAPSLLLGVHPAHRAAREEIFGPVLAVSTFRTPEEALALANHSPYGLAAGVWTEKGSKAQEFAARLQAGVVWVNSYGRFDPAAPFGGVRESGHGRVGGRAGIRFYLEPQA